MGTNDVSVDSFSFRVDWTASMVILLARVVGIWWLVMIIIPFNNIVIRRPALTVSVIREQQSMARAKGCLTSAWAVNGPCIPMMKVSTHSSNPRRACVAAWTVYDVA
jgi:hypothetical protein